MLTTNKSSTKSGFPNSLKSCSEIGLKSQTLGIFGEIYQREMLLYLWVSSKKELGRTGKNKSQPLTLNTPETTGNMKTSVLLRALKSEMMSMSTIRLKTSKCKFVKLSKQSNNYWQPAPNLYSKPSRKLIQRKQANSPIYSSKRHSEISMLPWHQKNWIFS